MYSCSAGAPSLTAGRGHRHPRGPSGQPLRHLGPTDAATSALCETSTIPTVLSSLDVRDPCRGLRRRCLDECGDQQAVRRGPRILVPDAALAQIARPALAGQQRRSPRPPPRRRHAPRRSRTTERVHGRYQRIHHGLVARRRPAQRHDPAHPGSERFGQLFLAHLGGIPERLAGTAQQRAVQRSRRAADLRDQLTPGEDQDRTGECPVPPSPARPARPRRVIVAAVEQSHGNRER